MNLLLDTCSFLWLISDSPAFPESARCIYQEAEHVYISVISEWEIAIKHSLGRLPLPSIPNEYIPGQRMKHEVESLPLYEQAALHVSVLPDIHKDPFDRMLVSQAIIHGLTILSPDSVFRSYPAPVCW
ncbi:MAG: type II toxin-antitoxin system VapC family toxin [Spirochaetota bacterium]